MNYKLQKVVFCSEYGKQEKKKEISVKIRTYNIIKSTIIFIYTYRNG